jgi:Flp pilus assembly protein TadD
VSGLYQEILQGTSHQADAVCLLGEIAQQTGQPEQAIERIRRALAVVPNQARCYKILGLAQIALGMADEAETSFQGSLLSTIPLTVTTTWAFFG